MFVGSSRGVVVTGSLWYVVMFSLVIGATMPAFWLSAVVAGRVPEIAEGKKEIWFHIAAEMLTAAVLIAGATAIWITGGGDLPVGLSSAGLGLLLYSTTVSPGYYADLREWPMVVMFGTVWVGALAGLAVLLAA